VFVFFQKQNKICSAKGLKIRENFDENTTVSATFGMFCIKWATLNLTKKGS
jgi:tRNA A37 threonylcarbamoyladenosine dehydratase